MYGVVQPRLIKDLMDLQNYTNSETMLVGPCGETYPASHDANQAVNIKSEEVSDTQEEADSVGITIQEIKAEHEVSCMSTIRHHKYAKIPFVFLICLTACAHETIPH
jgi:hypothetical protein